MTSEWRYIGAQDVIQIAAKELDSNKLTKKAGCLARECPNISAITEAFKALFDCSNNGSQQGGLAS